MKRPVFQIWYVLRTIITKSVGNNSNHLSTILRVFTLIQQEQLQSTLHSQDLITYILCNLISLNHVCMLTKSTRCLPKDICLIQYLPKIWVFLQIIFWEAHMHNITQQ